MTVMGNVARLRSRVPLLWRYLNSDLFSSTFAFGSTAFVRLASSLILTRLLSPRAYGTLTILLTIAFTIEMVSDVGATDLLVRHPRGNEVRFVHTIWTIRLLRSCANCAIVYFAAPLVALLYRDPALTEPCRLCALFFPLAGTESMSFVLAIRNQKARIRNYTEFITNILMTISVIALAFILRNVYALILGLLLQRILLSIGSHFFYREIGVGFAFDREAIAAQFSFARFVTPSSFLTMLQNNYDKFIFLRLFTAPLLGLYGISGSMLGPIRNIIDNNARAILYARCSEYFRTDRKTACTRYYKENTRLIALGILLPAVVAGFSQSIVSILYDPRYVEGGYILMVLGLGTIVIAFVTASENLLVASGFTRAILMGNVMRLGSLVPASLLGYYFYGFRGFLWFNLAAGLVPLAYFYRKQHNLGLLRFSIEMRRFGAALGVFVVCLTFSHLLLTVIPHGWLHLGAGHRAHGVHSAVGRSG